MYGLFVLIIYFSRDVIIFTIIVEKHDSQNATMKSYIVEQKSMKKKLKVSSTINESETENYSQLSTLEFNITQNIPGTLFCTISGHMCIFYYKSYFIYNCI